jgi:hypothetical protein
MVRHGRKTSEKFCKGACHYAIALVRLFGNEFAPQEFEDQQPAEFLCNLMKHCSG